MRLFSIYASKKKGLALSGGVPLCELGARLGVLLLQFLRSLHERKAIGHLLKICPCFILLHGNRFEEERLAAHIDAGLSYFPVAWARLCLRHVKLSALI